MPPIGPPLEGRATRLPALRDARLLHAVRPRFTAWQTGDHSAQVAPSCLDLISEIGGRGIGMRRAWVVSEPVTVIFHPCKTCAP